MASAKTLILKSSEIRRLLAMPQAMIAVENIFRDYGLGKAVMPPKVYLAPPQCGGDFRAMPAYSASLKRASVKWVNTHADNPRKGYPAVMAIVILSDPLTGFPLAIMDGTYLTGIRTGAAGGVAAKYLARRESAVLGLVGCGVQARTQLLALRTIFKFTHIKVWGKEPPLRDTFVREMSQPHESMVATSDIKSCVLDSDIIVTTTPSHQPLVKWNWVKPGAHINAIGADAAGKQELDPKILQKGKVVVDDLVQASHSGEINVPWSRKQVTAKQIYATLGQIICGQRRGRTRSNEITIFDSTGLAIQDLALADLIYRHAVKMKRGRWIELLNSF